MCSPYTPIRPSVQNKGQLKFAQIEPCSLPACQDDLAVFWRAKHKPHHQIVCTLWKAPANPGTLKKGKFEACGKPFREKHMKCLGQNIWMFDWQLCSSVTRLPPTTLHPQTAHKLCVGRYLHHVLICINNTGHTSSSSCCHLFSHKPWLCRTIW